MSPVTFKRNYFLLLFLTSLTFSGCGNKSETTNVSDTAFVSLTGDGAKDSSQILAPCHWTFSVEQNSPGEAILVSTAKLDSGWHLYSQNISDKKISTSFTYGGSPDYNLTGPTEEGEAKKKYDPYLEVEVLFFEHEAVFKQKIKVLGKKDFTISGTIDYRVCLDQCITSDEEFSFEVKGNSK